MTKMKDPQMAVLRFARQHEDEVQFATIATDWHRFCVQLPGSGAECYEYESFGKAVAALEVRGYSIDAGYLRIF